MTLPSSDLDSNPSTGTFNKTSPLAVWEQEKLEILDEQLAYILKQLQSPVFFDSESKGATGLYNIISGEPVETSATCKYKTLIDNFYQKIENIPPTPLDFEPVPFSLGLAGFVSYDYGEESYIGSRSEYTEEKDDLNPSTEQASIYIGMFTWSLVKNLEEDHYQLTFSPLCTESARAKIRDIIKNSSNVTAQSDVELADIQWKKSCSEQDYNKRLARIQSYINQGDCYQVNFAQYFSAESNINSIDYYMFLREKTRTPYSCYMEISPNYRILSFSPEQFIGINERIIETKPIKGTIENRSNSNNATILENSTKDRAENLMIVDLLRNDLSKVCQLHSVKVDKLFNLETFNNVHHLVSHISGLLEPEVSEIDAFLSCFPGGSITGAPKKRAIEIINELEIAPRGAYCGSIFYLNYNGRFDSNILIRTIVHSRDKLICWGGGGITSGSDIQSEYNESLIKVANLTGLRN